MSASGPAVFHRQGLLCAASPGAKGLSIPGPIPFPLLHIDTGYKFREMIEFRDRYTAELGVKLIVHRNRRSFGRWCKSVRVGNAALLRCAKNDCVIGCSS